ncbi:hypothetical protein ScPMuIL_013962 [Solemya velum]
MGFLLRRCLFLSSCYGSPHAAAIGCPGRDTGLPISRRKGRGETADVVSPSFVSTGNIGILIRFRWDSHAGDLLYIIIRSATTGEETRFHSINSDGKGKRCVDVAEGTFQLILRARLGHVTRIPDNYRSTITDVTQFNYPCPGTRNCNSSIPNGRVSDSCSLKPGELCSVTCDPDYFSPVLTNLIKCLGRAVQEWNYPLNEICLRDKCTRELPHGFFHSDCEFRRFEYCKFSCHDGYASKRGDRLLCKDSFRIITRAPYWAADPSTLCAVQCPRTPHVWGCDGWVSEVCSFQCEYGYKKVYYGDITCLASGNWSTGSTPLCAKIPEPDEEGLKAKAVIFIAMGIGVVILFVIILAKSMGSRSDMNNRENFWNHAASVMTSEPPHSETESHSHPSAPPQSELDRCSQEDISGTPQIHVSPLSPSAPPPAYNEVVTSPYIEPPPPSYDMCSTSKKNTDGE